MNTIVIPDVHHKIELAERIIALESHDGDRLQIIFLGDYFDDWHDGPLETTITANWLLRSAKANDGHKRIFLLGNHDLPYLYPGVLDSIDRCGDSPEKRVAAQSVLYRTNVSRQMRLYTELDDWVLSHAGITRALWSKYDGLSGADLAMDMLLNNKVHPLLLAGEDRGGNLSHGGMLWCDWGSFTPVHGVRQLVGHTPAAEVRYRDIHNYCLDTHLRHYAVYHHQADTQTGIGPHPHTPSYWEFKSLSA